MSTITLSNNKKLLYMTAPDNKADILAKLLEAMLHQIAVTKL